MKRVEKTTSRTARSKSPRSAKTVDEYVDAIPDAALAHFAALRTAVRSAVPKDAVEVISYGIPALKQQKVLVWYAAFAKHCSLFPTAAVLKDFEEELKGFQTSKGTVQFPLDKRLPTALIKKIVKARVAEASGKQAGRKRG